jgi:hypothetical protein
MGIEDRDWYQDEQLRRLKKSPKPRGWLVIFLFWAVVFFVLFQFLKHHEEISIKWPFSFNFRQATPAPDPPAAQTSYAEPNNPQTMQQPVPVRHQQQIVSQVDQEPTVESRPQGSATIYRCKAYSGGIFWSSAHCGTQQALIDRMVTVPNGLPFEQQVQIAEGQRVAAMTLYDQKPSAEVQRSDQCLALKRERETIESRYTNWQWQPLEVINPDQTRMRGLRAEQARLGCPTQ